MLNGLEIRNIQKVKILPCTMRLGYTECHHISYSAVHIAKSKTGLRRLASPLTNYRET
jgi:hypothetical protein